MASTPVAYAPSGDGGSATVTLATTEAVVEAKQEDAKVPEVPPPPPPEQNATDSKTMKTPETPAVTEDENKMQVDEEGTKDVVKRPNAEKTGDNKPKFLSEKNEWLWSKSRGWFEGIVNYRLVNERRRLAHIHYQIQERNRVGQVQRMQRASALNSSWQSYFPIKDYRTSGVQKKILKQTSSSTSYPWYNHWY